MPNLIWSNIAREVPMDAGVDATVPAVSTVMACSTGMVGAIEAAGMIDGDALVGGVDSLSRIQVRLGQKIDYLTDLHLKDVRLYIPAISNRTTDMSMGEHTEITAKAWQIGRAEQEEIGDVRRDTIPRKDTSLEKLARLPPSFDHTRGQAASPPAIPRRSPMAPRESGSPRRRA